MNILYALGVAAITAIVALSGFNTQPVEQNMGATIPTAVALWESSLATAITSSATSMTLTSAVDKAGTTFASSTYAFVIDSGTSQEEMVIANCTATACTGMTRGISPITGTSTVVSLQYAHRRGASVKITDGPQLLILSRILNGQETLPNAIRYDSHPTFTSDTQLVDKKYADDTIAGLVGTATDSTFGTVKLSVAAASTTNPIAVGDNDTRVPTQGENNALVGDDTSITVGTGNKYVTQTGLQNMAESYATTTGTSTALLLTLSPAPVALTAGMEVNFKSSTTTTGAVTLTLLNLATTTIKKLNDQDLVSGDIESGQIVKVKYDGTYWQMISPTATPAATVDVQTFSASSTWTKPAGALKVLVQLWGAGGSGANINASIGSRSAGGGGGGMYTERWLNAADLGASETVTIGAGGAAISTNSTNGIAGGNTTFGSFETAIGGGAGIYNGNGGDGGKQLLNVLGLWGAGGVAGSSGPGGAGLYSGGGGSFVTTVSGAGGASRYGGGGGGGTGTSDTVAGGGASTYGGAGGTAADSANATAGAVPGGGGGAVGHEGGTYSSGAGGNGKAIVTTFF